MLHDVLKSIKCLIQVMINRATWGEDIVAEVPGLSCGGALLQLQKHTRKRV